MKHTFWPLLLALLAGLGLGLLYSWVISPVRYVNTTPASLRADFKDRYRALIAAAYAATGDLERARVRLSLLSDENPIEALNAQAQRMLAAGESLAAIRQVAQLATDLQNALAVSPSPTGIAMPLSASPTEPTLSLPLSPPTETPITANPTETLSPLPTLTPLPRPSPTATLSLPFRLISQESLCDENLPPAQMQIIVQDVQQKQLPGIEIIVTWPGGEDHFFTGLKPDLGNGYADFIMQADTAYSVQIASGGVPVSDLRPPLCTATNGASYTGGLRLTFRQ